jgi:hypothetical protein
LLLPTTPVCWRNEFKREARWLVVSDAGIMIIAIKVLEKPCPYVVGLPYIYPQGAKEAINPRRLGRV